MRLHTDVVTGETVESPNVDCLVPRPHLGYMTTDIILTTETRNTERCLERYTASVDLVQ